MGFWKQAETDSFYDPYRVSSKYAAGQIGMGAQAKRAAILGAGMSGRQSILGNLARSGMSRSLMGGGAGSERLGDFEEGIGNQLAGAQGEYEAQLGDLNFQTNENISNWKQRANQMRRSTSPGPLGFISAGIKAVSPVAKLLSGGIF